MTRPPTSRCRTSQVGAEDPPGRSSDLGGRLTKPPLRWERRSSNIPCRGGAARRPNAGPRIRAAQWTAPTMAWQLSYIPVGSGHDPTANITMSYKSGWRRGLTGEVVRPRREAYKASPTMARQLSPPVGAVQRAALTFVFRISGIRAARWTAPTMAWQLSYIPVGSGHDPTANITMSYKSGWRRGLTGEVIRPGREAYKASPTIGAEMVVHLL